MRYVLLTVLTLLCVTTVPTRADYIILVADANQKPKQPAGQAGQQGMVGAAGIMGGGAAGFPGGAGGFMGIPGGAAGIMGGFPGGAAGIMGGFPGGAGIMGGVSPGGVDGGEGFSGGMGFFGMVGGVGGGSQAIQSIRVMAVVEVKNRVQTIKLQPQQGNFVAVLDSKWGRVNLWGRDMEVQLLRRDGKVLSAVSKRFEDDLKTLTKKGPLQPYQYLNQAEWALTHGLTDKFLQMMTELSKVEPAHPAVVALEKVKADLARGMGGEGAAEEWRKKLFPSHKVLMSNHYVLLHNAPNEDSQEAQARINLLEENMRVVYYWHALKSKALPVPKDRMVAVLETGSEAAKSFFRHSEVFDAEFITADSFYSPRHNLIVFCGSRTDTPYEALVKSTEPFMSKFDRQFIIHPDPKKVRFPRDASMTMTDRWAAQSLGLLIRALDEDGAVASVTHSGTRQLLVASGILPRNVLLPRWVQFGMGSFFQTPYASPWKSPAAPNWYYFLTFQELKKEKRLEEPQKLLRNVITDHYFYESTRPILKALKKDGKDDKKSKSEYEEQAERTATSVKARATAWALTYYLAQKRLDGLQKYYQELSRLPRDLPLDDDVLLDVFARAFGLADANGKRNEFELDKLAASWISSMNNEVSLDMEARPIYEAIYKLQNELRDEQAEANKPTQQPTRPGFPGFPGGSPFPGGSGPSGGGPRTP